MVQVRWSRESRCVQVGVVEPSGELNVGLCYNKDTQRLIVSVVEARNLKVAAAAALDNASPGLP